MAVSHCLEQEHVTVPSRRGRAGIWTENRKGSVSLVIHSTMILSHAKPHISTETKERHLQISQIQKKNGKMAARRFSVDTRSPRTEGFQMSERERPGCGCHNTPAQQRRCSLVAISLSVKHHLPPVITVLNVDVWVETNMGWANIPKGRFKTVSGREKSTWHGDHTFCQTQSAGSGS